MPASRRRYVENYITALLSFSFNYLRLIQRHWERRHDAVFAVIVLSGGKMYATLANSQINSVILLLLRLNLNNGWKK